MYFTRPGYASRPPLASCTAPCDLVLPPRTLAVEAEFTSKTVRDEIEFSPGPQTLKLRRYPAPGKYIGGSLLIVSGGLLGYTIARTTWAAFHPCPPRHELLASSSESSDSCGGNGGVAWLVIGGIFIGFAGGLIYGLTPSRVQNSASGHTSPANFAFRPLAWQF